MPGFATQIKLLDRWHLVNHILFRQEKEQKAKVKPVAC